MTLLEYVDNNILLGFYVSPSRIPPHMFFFHDKLRVALEKNTSFVKATYKEYDCYTYTIRTIVDSRSSK